MPGPWQCATCLKQHWLQEGAERCCMASSIPSMPNEGSGPRPEIPPVVRDIVNMARSMAAGVPTAMAMLDEAEDILGIDTSAAVAQPAEQVLRKDEVGGSTPSSSSTGFNSRERDLMATVVSRTNALLESRERVNIKQAELSKLESEYKTKFNVLTNAIQREESAAQHYAERVREAEDDFRQAMVDGHIERMAPAITTEEAVTAPIDDEPLDIGRGE